MMAPLGWFLSRITIWAQKRDGLVIDSELVAGRAPGWARSTFWLLVLLMAWPFALWGLMRTLPDAWVIDVAQATWRLRPGTSNFSLLYCTGECRDLVFGVIALPAAWVVGAFGAVWWFNISAARVQYQRRLVQSQPSPVDRATGIDRIALTFRRWPITAALLVSCVALMTSVLSEFVGQVHYGQDGASTVYTTWRFALPCAVLSLTIASTGALAAIVRRLKQLS